MREQPAPIPGVPPLPPAFPCKAEDCDTINGILQQIATLQEAVRKCVSCGLPMQDQLDQLEARATLLQNMKAAFFPGAE